jgi:hypothetical protein
VGVTRLTDHLIAKVILGYRFNFQCTLEVPIFVKVSYLFRF